jgi:hypothetical protein
MSLVAVELVGVAMAAVETREGRLKFGEEKRPLMVHDIGYSLG